MVRDLLKGLTALMALLMTGASVAQVIVVAHGVGQFYPREYMVNGKLEGLHEKIVSNTAKKMGLTINYRALPWKRAIKALELGEIDALMYLGKTPQRQQFAYFHQGNMLSSANFRPMILLKNRSKIRFDGSLESLRNSRVAVGVDYYYGEPFDSAAFINKVPIESPSSALLANLLLLERIDVIIYDINSLKADLSADYVNKYFHAYQQIISSNHYYIAFSKRKRNAKFVKKFAQTALEYKSTEQYQQQLKYYKVLH